MKKNSAPNLMQLSALIALVSLIEVGLIIAGILPPIASYSPGNLVFLFARLAIYVYAGILFAKEGVKKAARNGAILALVSALIVCAGSLTGKFLLGKSVLGIPAPNTESLILILILVILGNTLMGTLIAGLAAFVKRLQ
jgi:hypothetical protein